MKTKPLAWLRSHICILTTLAIAGLTILLTSPTQAQTTTQFVQNGDFTEAPVPPDSTQLLSPNQKFGGELPNWSPNGLVWFYLPGNGTSGTTADTTGAKTAAVPNPWILYGPGNKSPVMNGLVNWKTGGNFVALDADMLTADGDIQGSLTQAINDLKPDTKTTLTFMWAGAQGGAPMFNFRTADQLMVSLCPTGPGGASLTSPIAGCVGAGGLPAAPGGSGQPSNTNMPTAGETRRDGSTIQTTETKQVANHGFNGWTAESFTFMTPDNCPAAGCDEILSFLARGQFSGLPPMALLADVSLTQQGEMPPPPTPVIPEPSTWLMIGMGFALIIGVAYRHPEWLRIQA